MSKVYLVAEDQELPWLLEQLKPYMHTVVYGAGGKFERSVIKQCDSVLVSHGKKRATGRGRKYKDLGVTIWVQSDMFTDDGALCLGVRREL